MTPQLENGYTKIADAILEKVAKTKLNGTQFRILMIVWRSTYGWNKKEYDLSLSYLADATGIHKQQIKREIDLMIEREILIVVKESTYTTARQIGFNKNYIDSIQLAEKSTVSEIAYPTVSENVDPTVSELVYQKRELNKHIKKECSDVEKVIDYYKYICSDFPQPRKVTDKRKSLISGRIADYKLAEVLTGLEKISESDFMKGNNNRNWKPDFDWIFNTNNFIKILEGKYDNKPQKESNSDIDRINEILQRRADQC